MVLMSVTGLRVLKMRYWRNDLMAIIVNCLIVLHCPVRSYRSVLAIKFVDLSAMNSDFAWIFIVKSRNERSIADKSGPCGIIKFGEHSWLDDVIQRQQIEAIMCLSYYRVQSKQLSCNWTKYAFEWDMEWV